MQQAIEESKQVKIYKTLQDIQLLIEQRNAGQNIYEIYKFQEILQEPIEQNHKLIGRGGFADVYCISIKNRDYAVKIMYQGRPNQKLNHSWEEICDQFHKEVDALTKIHDMQLLNLKGISIDTQKLCLITNYLEQGDLYNIIHSKKLFDGVEKEEERINKKIYLLQGISDGIHAIHSKQLIHRDIKSLNILLDDMNNPKIADLGLLTNIDSIEKESIGTLQWMSPEGFRNDFSFASDIWALACVAVEIFSEQLPWTIHPNLIKEYLIQRKEHPKIPDGLDQDLYQLLKDCFSYQKQERPDIMEFTQRLKDIRKKYRRNLIQKVSGGDNKQIMSQIQGKGNITEFTQFISSGMLTSPNEIETDQLVNQDSNMTHAQQINYFITKGGEYQLFRTGKTQFTQKRLINAKIDFDSVVYVTNEAFFISGGGPQSNLRYSLQYYDRLGKTKINEFKSDYPRYAHGVIWINRKIYLIAGGIDENEDQPVSEVVDFKEGTFKNIAQICVETRNFGLTQINKFIYVFGGKFCGSFGLSAVQKYDTELDRWIMFLDPLPSASPCTAYKSFNNNNIYIFGERLAKIIILELEDEDPFKEAGQKYPGKNVYDPIIEQEEALYVYDRFDIWCFDLKTNIWDQCEILD